MSIQSLLSAFLVRTLLLVSYVRGQSQENKGIWDTDKTLSIGYVVFPGFEPMDVWGPLEIFFQASIKYNMTLSTISYEKGPVSARPPPHHMIPGGPLEHYDYILGPSTVATHTFADAPAVDVLIVPGGAGYIPILMGNNTDMETFIAQRAEETKYVLSVCTGSVILARSGLLKGKRATSNKSAWSEVVDPANGDNITWVPSARWVEDGKVWTSSGVTAGLDMTYAFLTRLYGTQKINEVMNIVEYAPHVDPHWDPFSVVYKLPGAEYNRSLADCVVPAGY